MKTGKVLTGAAAQPKAAAKECYSQKSGGVIGTFGKKHYSSPYSVEYCENGKVREEVCFERDTQGRPLTSTTVFTWYKDKIRWGCLFPLDCQTYGRYLSNEDRSHYCPALE